MSIKPSPSDLQQKAPPRKRLIDVIESKRMTREEPSAYRRLILNRYDGFAGHLTGLTGFVTGHETLAGRVISPRAFDVRGCKRILDAACGNGRYSRVMLKHADADAFITGFDLSQAMIRRARHSIKGSRVSHVAADITKLPYPDQFFDAVVCGWVLEHFPDPRPALRELFRVLQPGGKMLLLVTEDTITGSFCSRMWHCRTYSRQELKGFCQDVGLKWERPLYFSGIHRLFKLGGIVVELRR